MRYFAIFILSLAFLGLFEPVCNASISKEMTYKESVVWRCAVRFVRVDQQFKIIEKDKETGYILFEYKNGNRKYNASMEIIKTVKDGLHYVRVQINIEDMPKYIENVFFDHFSRKIRSEYGMPPFPMKVFEPNNNSNNDSNNKNNAATKNDANNEDDLEVDEDDLNESVDD